jgi:gliding motility-associated-like protein
MGCDSVISSVNLIVNTTIVNNISASICTGQSYTLPSGKTVNITGIYIDTVKYAKGCDSLVTTVNLTLNPVYTASINASVCAGQSYTLPSGTIVLTPGTYKDTTRYMAGCDSLISTVNLSIKGTLTQSVNASICGGLLYTLPSGKTVNTAGTFRDTVRFAAGCDSLISTIHLTARNVIRYGITETICSGQTFSLPSGNVVNSPGVYTDTVKYVAGCDSAIATVMLVIKPTIINTTNFAICSGKTYTLPWGKTVNASGIYKDTIRYTTGCDSVVTIVNLSVAQPLTHTTTAAVCSGNTYTLPSGVSVNKTGMYQDTIRYASGCDSLVTVVQLTVNPNPVISLSKSNDVDCVLGTSNLTTVAGYKYQWSPAQTLSNATVNNPVASPTATTIYKVKVISNKGCVTHDSIEVKVSKGDANNGYLVPSAFTPNNDHKNDCFGVKSWGSITNLQFNVYDRWGRLVFHSTDPSHCWDGTFQGESLGAATFVYHVSANTNCGRVFRKGTVVLIR